jgi:hypothetical protein
MNRAVALYAIPMVGVVIAAIIDGRWLLSGAFALMIGLVFWYDLRRRRPT